MSFRILFQLIKRKETTKLNILDSYGRPQCLAQSLFNVLIYEKIKMDEGVTQYIDRIYDEKSTRRTKLL